jgi:predicted TIM-barrel fold metal-dependent hydrolase
MPPTTRIVSADAHVLEPPDIWENFLPSQYLEKAPKLVQDDKGGDAWSFSFGPPDPIGLVSTPGRRYDEFDWMGARYDEIRPACFSGKDRLGDLDYDGIWAEVIFPPQRTMGHFMGDPDVEFSLAGVDAYNRFLQESFCAPDPSRLIGAYQIPAVGIDESVAYAKRAIAEGFKTVVISAWPAGGKETSEADDPFWAVCAEASVPVCIHINLAPREERLAVAKAGSSPGARGDRKDKGRALAGLGAVGMGFGLTLSKLIFSGTFDRFPNLKVVGVETGVGWVPHILEQMDDRYWRNRSWTDIELERLPSEYYYRNIFLTFIVDRFGALNWQTVGRENAMWSTDYPHHGCDWPYSRKVIEESFLGVPREVRDDWIANNAIRVFNLA